MTAATSDEANKNKQQQTLGMTGQLSSSDELSYIVSKFPHVSHAFGYGSGALSQGSGLNDGGEKPMLDLIFVVDDPLKFHTDNMRDFPEHYPLFVHAIGRSGVVKLQQYPAGVYYVPYVKVNRMIKYGVVAKDALIRDLNFWNYLYIAGRMQKPTVSVPEYICSNVEDAQTNNLTSAVSAALLLLSPPTAENSSEINLTKLFEQIAALSYQGDPRITFRGEDPNKVNKLVHSPGQFSRFSSLYQHPLSDLSENGILNLNLTQPSDSSKLDGVIQLDYRDVSLKKHLFNLLPPQFRSLENAPVETLGYAFSGIVAHGAWRQTMKGLLTAGAVKSVKYAAAKVMKGIRK